MKMYINRHSCERTSPWASHRIHCPTVDPVLGFQVQTKQDRGWSCAHWPEVGPPVTLGQRESCSRRAPTSPFLTTPQHSHLPWTLPSWLSPTKPPFLWGKLIRQGSKIEKPPLWLEISWKCEIFRQSSKCAHFIKAVAEAEQVAALSPGSESWTPWRWVSSVPASTADTLDKAERIILFSWASDCAFVNRKAITKWLLGPC